MNKKQLKKLKKSIMAKKTYPFIMVFFIIGFMLLAMPIYASSLHLSPTEDTYANTLVNQDLGDLNYIEIGAYTTSNSYAFIKFDISSIPSYQIIYKADLCIYMQENNRFVNESMFEIRNITNQNWTEHNINNTGQMPIIYNNVSYENVTNEINIWRCFDVTGLTHYYYKAGFKNATYEINTTAEIYYHYGRVKAASKESSYPEYLNLSYYYANSSYDYCYDELTLITGEFLIYNGKEYNISFPRHCEKGCDDVTNTCNPPQYQQDFINMIIIIFIFIGIFLLSMFAKSKR